MVDFACKEFEIEAVIKCGLNLTKSDLQVLKHFLQFGQNWLNTEHIAEELGLNLSTVQRSVKKLRERGVVQRRQENLSGGGYVFLYQIEDKRKIREVISDIVMSWARTVKAELQKW